MTSTCALGAVAAALLAALKANVALVAAVPANRIVDETPSRPTYPYILVEGSGETPFNTMGASDAPKYGSSTRVSVRVVSQYRGDAQVCELMSLVKGAIDGQKLTPSGYPTGVVSFASGVLLKDTVAGVVTRELVADFEMTVHQA